MPDLDHGPDATPGPALRDRFATTLREAAQGAEIRDPYPYADQLLTRWSEPQRRYHTVDHLRAVLDHVDTLARYADDPDLVRLAAWFHDAVYRPDRSENEERSARLAELALPEAGLSQDGTDEVARLVRLTTTHAAAEDDRNGAVLCDADLAVLGSPPETYDAYAAAVREEYGFIPEADFRAGRAAILEQLLDLPRLFRTPHGELEWEARARRNLAAELRTLTA
ncbi:HD domain-containing protein [Streptomyces liangshanensis]|uniref:HD domain-containing protein n=1 Tax=Streptomyces liangshanensis TaxID=2717324 RepID=A0A6G9H150_9ACTN|nr:HD domain-containing protein [Streptomyces liangshanensis]QIQ04190.1 HD domain-containing protein [Streptomyces liangshanensis]